MQEELTDRECGERWRLLQAKTIVRIFEEYGQDPEAFAEALKANTDARGKIIPLPEVKFE